MTNQEKDDTERPDGRQDKKRRGQRHEAKNTTTSPIPSWWAKDDARDLKEGIVERLKNNHNKRFGGFLHFLNRPNLAVVAPPPSTRLLVLSPPGRGFNDVLDCCAVCTSSARRFAICSFSVTKLEVLSGTGRLPFLTFISLLAFLQEPS